MTMTLPNLKNLIIKKFDGISKDEFSLYIEIFEKKYTIERQARKDAQYELERLKNWRNNVAKTLRANKVNRRIINKIMEIKND